jgi:hypothetical protein
MERRPRKIPATTPKPKIIEAAIPMIKPDECCFNAVLLVCDFDAKTRRCGLPSAGY